MGLALPTWWVIQLVCRLSVNTTVTPEPFRHLDCSYNVNNRTTANVVEFAVDDDFPDEIHRLYYRCNFQSEQKTTGVGVGDCRNTDPPLPLFVNDSQSFDLEQEFPRKISLKVTNFTVNSTSTTSPSPILTTVWLTLPKFPRFNDTLFQNVHLKCHQLLGTGARILCVLETDEETGSESFWSKYELKILFVIAVLCAIAAGGVGNILVCLAVCLDRRLQNVTNYFLLSLAVADLLVSLFVMPLGAIQGFFGYWPLGIVWCNVYVSCDVLACSCSILHMVSISWGRYLGIRNPLKMRHAYATKRVVGIKIAVVWMLSFTVSTPVTLLGIYDSRNIMPEPNVCVINNSIFFVIGSLVAFYIPGFIMVVTFILTWRLLRQKARFLRQTSGNEQEPHTFRRLGGRFRKPSTSRQTSSTMSMDEAVASGNIPPSERSLSTRHKWKTKISKSQSTISSSRPSLIGVNVRGTANNETTNGARSTGINKNTRATNTNSLTARNSRIRTLRLPLNVTPSNLNLRFLPSRNRRQNDTMASNAVHTEQKASKVLGLVFGSFVICWLPFFSINVLFGLCPKSVCHIPGHVVDIALWLGYASSIINPIIYTIFNRTFRAAFARYISHNFSFFSSSTNIHNSGIDTDFLYRRAYIVERFFDRLLKCKCRRLSRPPRYRSVNENRNSALMAQTPSSAAAGAATVPLSLSLQSTPLVTPSSASSYLSNVRTPVAALNHSESFDMPELSTITLK